MKTVTIVTIDRPNTISIDFDKTGLYGREVAFLTDFVCLTLRMVHIHGTSEEVEYAYAAMAEEAVKVGLELIFVAK